ncbi:alpha/beta hydrolase family protein [Parvularcula oceani]|uniref:alpha/beta hydrolase family protein n=1 Tax=Parvularcula oceani TaxID=1247963 RepID=UPI0004E158E0|nr:prolyl oligopeptidase family serine peptidase [Parvularcula oceani]
MKFKACLTAMVGAMAATAVAEPLPIEDLAREPAITSVTMSADGSYLVGLITPPGDEGSELALTVWDLEEGGPPTVTPSNDRMRFFYAQALKADKLFVGGRQAWTGALRGCGEGKSVGSTATFLTKLYMTDKEMDDFDEAFTKSRKTRGVSEATERCFELAGTASLYQDLPLDPNDVIVQRVNQANFVTEYVRVNLKSGAEELIYRSGGGEAADLFDPRTGELLVKARTEPANGDYQFQVLIRDDATGEFNVHDPLTSSARDRYTVSVVGRDEQSGNYYVVTDKFSDTADVYFYDPVARSFSDEALFALDKFEASGVVLSRREADFGKLLGFRYMADTGKTYWVDPEWDSMMAGVEAAFPGQNVGVIDYTDDLSKILFETSSSANPPGYHLLIDRKAVQTLGNERPWIETEDLRKTDLVYYTARDGQEIPGFLTLPKGFEPGSDTPLPAVVLPHGGPWARDTAGWDGTGWPQFLATRGYAVLQPQYRGSTGWGRDLWLAGDAQWGLAMQDDKDDGAQWLVEQGIADPDRIAIFGYSYGGFAAMAATVREDGPFRCAIAGAGVSNLERIGRGWSDNRLQRILQGRTVRGMDPLENADKANIPILIYHGDRDVRVPLFHAKDFYDRVKDRVDAELLVVDDMPHSLPWWPEQHEETLAAIEGFLADDCEMK